MPTVIIGVTFFDTHTVVNVGGVGGGGCDGGVGKRIFMLTFL